MQDEIGPVVGRGEPVLADGGVETRVMFDDAVPMDPVAALGASLTS
jgi:hypothetical protein